MIEFCAHDKHKSSDIYFACLYNFLDMYELCGTQNQLIIICQTALWQALSATLVHWHEMIST